MAYQFLLFLFMVLAVSPQAYAKKVADFSVYFAINQTQLDANAQNGIDQFLAELPHRFFAYQVRAKGFADARGNTAQNLLLSNNRAQQVVQYLAKKGFTEKQLEVSKTENTELYNADTTNHWRRVDLEFHVSDQSLENLLGIEKAAEVVKIQAGKAQKVWFNDQTVWQIPAKAFVNQNGEVVSGEVKLHYQSYTRTNDFVLGEIPMSFHQDGEMVHFNSAGMFAISAQQQGEELQVAEGKALTVDMPLQHQEPGTDFWQLDTATGEWKRLQNLVPMSQASSPERNAFPLGCTIELPNTKVSYAPDDRTKAFVAYRMAMDYAKNGWTFEERLDSLRLLEIGTNGNGVEINQLRDDISFSQRQHNRISKKLDANQTYFSVSGDKWKNVRLSPGRVRGGARSTYTNAVNPLRTYYFTLDNRSDQHEELLKNTMFWHDVRLVQNEQHPEGVLVLKNEDTTLRLELKYFAKGKKKQPLYQQTRAKLNAELLKLRKNVDRKRKDLQMEKEMLESALTNKRNKLQNLLDQNVPLYTIRAAEDSLLDLRAHYLTLTKDSTFAKAFLQVWGKEQDANREKFIGAYKTWSESDSFKVQYGFYQKWYKKERAREDSIARVSNALATLRKTLQIDQMGIYNADQVKRISNKQIAEPQYVDAAGDEVQVVVLFMTDREINGSIRYDGYMGYSPYRFAHSPENIEMLIAVDLDGEVYQIDSGILRNEAKPRITLVPSKEEVRQLLVAR